METGVIIEEHDDGTFDLDVDGDGLPEYTDVQVMQ